MKTFYTAFLFHRFVPDAMNVVVITSKGNKNLDFYELQTPMILILYNDRIAVIKRFEI